VNAPGDASLNAADRLAIMNPFAAYAQDRDAGKLARTKKLEQSAAIEGYRAGLISLMRSVEVLSSTGFAAALVVPLVAPYARRRLRGQSPAITRA
jgi:hypothetical protein